MAAPSGYTSPELAPQTLQKPLRSGVCYVQPDPTLTDREPSEGLVCMQLDVDVTDTPYRILLFCPVACFSLYHSISLVHIAVIHCTMLLLKTNVKLKIFHGHTPLIIGLFYS